MYDGFTSNIFSYGIPLVEESCMSMMDAFGTPIDTDFRQELKRSFNIFCAFESIPTWLVNGCLGVPIFQITKIVNTLLSQDASLGSIKLALVKSFKNYPVWTVHFKQILTCFKSVIFI